MLLLLNPPLLVPASGVAQAASQIRMLLLPNPPLSVPHALRPVVP